jgi:mono/diheme cytochrome c family protein
MTLYMLFAGLGTSVYIGMAYADAAFFDFDSPLFFAFLSNVLAALLLLCGYRLQRTHSFSVGHASAWGTRIVVGALVVFAGTVAVLIAATREPGRSLTCSGHCGTEDEGVVAGASIASPIGSQTAAVGSESARAVAGGRTLFYERGCAGCHRPDATGIGPTLHRLFGSPVQDPACGFAFVDESYLREAIENPSATVAVGFPPVMPSFAGQLTEKDLQALIEYLMSLSVRPAS